MNNPQQSDTKRHGFMMPRRTLRRILAVVFRGSVLATLASSLMSAPARANQTIVVPRDYPTIQAAVDAAAAGSTIKVNAGTYAGQIVIGKNLTLLGAGVDMAVIQAPATFTPYAFFLPLQSSVVAVVRVTDGASVSISGFTVSGPTPCGEVGQGIAVVKGATLSLKDSRVTRIRPEATCPPAVARGIVVGLPPIVVLDGQQGSTGNATIKSVTVDQFQTAGITVIGPPGGLRSTATVASNLIVGGASPFNRGGQSGIELAGAIDAQVTENTVRGTVCNAPFCGPDPITQSQSAGINVSGPADVMENQVSDNDIGIYQIGAVFPPTIKENTVSNNRYFGIVIQDGDGATYQNTISGGQVGIAVVADNVNTTGTLHGDTISGTSVMSVQELDCCGFTATAIVLSK